jgi:hypothetical protein
LTYDDESHFHLVVLCEDADTSPNGQTAAQMVRSMSDVTGIAEQFCKLPISLFKKVALVDGEQTLPTLGIDIK